MDHRAGNVAAADPCLYPAGLCCVGHVHGRYRNAAADTAPKASTVPPKGASKGKGKGKGEKVVVKSSRKREKEWPPLVKVKSKAKARAKVYRQL